MKAYLLLFLILFIGVGVLIFSSFTPEVKQEASFEYVKEKQVYADTPVRKNEKTTKIDEEKSENVQLKDRLKIVANQYEKNMQYPPYSQPLSKKQFNLLNPNIFRTIQMKLDPNRDIKASLKLNAFRIFQGEAIEINITLASPVQSNGFDLEKIELFSKQKLVAEITFSKDKVNENTKYFSASYSPSSDESETWAQELFIKASFHDEQNKKYVIASSFKYIPAQAELSDVKQAYVNANELVIPLELKVYSDGRYLVKANVFTKEGTPIAHVYAKKNIEKGKGELLLKVHASTLRLKNAEGPYVLKDFTIVKVITSVVAKKGYGLSLKSEYEVNGFSLDTYSTEPYHNKAQEQKLEFLKKISS